MPTKDRLDAMRWWNSLSIENKTKKLRECNSFIIGDNTRHPKTLTGSEIEIIYKLKN